MHTNTHLLSPHLEQMVQHKVHTPGTNKVLTHMHTYAQTFTYTHTYTYIHTHTRTHLKPWADGAAQGTHAWREQGTDTQTHTHTH